VPGAFAFFVFFRGWDLGAGFFSSVSSVSWFTAGRAGGGPGAFKVQRFKVQRFNGFL